MTIEAKLFKHCIETKIADLYVYSTYDENIKQFPEYKDMYDYELNKAWQEVRDLRKTLRKFCQAGVITEEFKNTVFEAWCWYDRYYL